MISHSQEQEELYDTDMVAPFGHGNDPTGNHGSQKSGIQSLYVNYKRQSFAWLQSSHQGLTLPPVVLKIKELECRGQPAFALKVTRRGIGERRR